MYEQQRFGQKNGQGFYQYEKDKKGKPKKLMTLELMNYLRLFAQQSVLSPKKKLLLE